MHTRRKFLRDCSLTAVAVALAPAALAQPRATAMSGQTLADFQACLNSQFTVNNGSQTMSLELIQAAAFSPPLSAAGDGSFLLRFRGPASMPLGQDTYEFANEQFGRLPIFIVPGRAAKGQLVYEAVFNRPANPAEVARQLASAPRPQTNS